MSNQVTQEDQSKPTERPVKIVVIDGKPYRMVRRFLKRGAFVRVEPSIDGKRVAVETLEPVLQVKAE